MEGEGEGEGGRKETKREEHSEGIQEGTPRVGCRRKKDVGESSKRKDKVDVGGPGRFNSLARNLVVGLDSMTISMQLRSSMDPFTV